MILDMKKCEVCEKHFAVENKKHFRLVGCPYCGLFTEHQTDFSYKVVVEKGND